MYVIKVNMEINEVNRQWLKQVSYLKEILVKKLFMKILVKHGLKAKNIGGNSRTRGFDYTVTNAVFMDESSFHIIWNFAQQIIIYLELTDPGILCKNNYLP